VGATVIEPDAGFFDKPISTLDFASLYPSIMGSNNLCFSTLVTDRSLLPHLVTKSGQRLFQDFAIEHPVGDDKITRHYAFVTHVRSVLADALIALLAERKTVKKQMESTEDPFLREVLNKRQLALKVVCNSVYGFTGVDVDKGLLSCKPVAAVTTLIGRRLIGLTKTWVETHFKGSRVVYGDSVTGDTALVLQVDGELQTRRIDELVDDDKWRPFHGDKEAADLPASVHVWTESGFTPIRRVVRHACGKRLFRVLTHGGIVDATEDHSLLSPAAERVRPADVGVGSRLLHAPTLPVAASLSAAAVTDVHEAWAMGLFMADGSADVYDCPSGSKATWAINKADLALLQQAASKLPFSTEVLDTLESSGVYKLVPRGNGYGENVRIAQQYRELFYNGAREKVVPPSILNASDEVAQAFWDGFYAGDGDHGGQYVRVDQRGKQSCTGLQLLAQRLGYAVSINERSDKPNIFRLTLTRGAQRKPADVVKRIRELPPPAADAYVYDLETESHHFHVGPGRMVVHNTDSVMILWGVDKLEQAFALGEDAAGRVTQYLRETLISEQGASDAASSDSRDISKMVGIIKLEHEKEYWPYLLLKKKNYAGRKWTPKSFNPLVLKDEVDMKGIQAVRRDTVPFIADLSKALLDALLIDKSADKALALVRSTLHEVSLERLPLEKYIMSKSIASSYANEATIPHVAAWNRMKMRGDEDPPPIGGRMPFVFVNGSSAVLATRAEHPEHVRMKKLKLDTAYYISAAVNPVKKLLQFFDDGTLDEVFTDALNVAGSRHTHSLMEFLGEEDSTPAPSPARLSPKPAAKKRRTVGGGACSLDDFA